MRWCIIAALLAMACGGARHATKADLACQVTCEGSAAIHVDQGLTELLQKDEHGLH